MTIFNRRLALLPVLIMLALIIASIIAFIVLRPSPDTEFKRPPDQLTHEAQLRECPPSQVANLAEITLANGRIADVEILDLPGGRIYLPRNWITTPQPYYANGIRANSSTQGAAVPFRGEGAQSLCRAQAYTIGPIAGAAAGTSADPRFSLNILFSRYTTISPDGADKLHSDNDPHSYNQLSLLFFGPENLEFARNRTDEVAGGWSLTFPVAADVWANILIGPTVPKERWLAYSDKAGTIYHWLKTKPAERGVFPENL